MPGGGAHDVSSIVAASRTPPRCCHGNLFPDGRGKGSGSSRPSCARGRALSPFGRRGRECARSGSCGRLAWCSLPLQKLLPDPVSPRVLGTRSPSCCLGKTYSSLSVGTCEPNCEGGGGGREGAWEVGGGAFGSPVATPVTEMQSLFGLWDCHSPPCAEALHCAMLGGDTRGGITLLFHHLM